MTNTARFPHWVAAAAVLVLISACTTDPVTVGVMRIEGRVYDVPSSVGIEGVNVALSWGAGAFGRGTSSPAASDVTGTYTLSVTFDPPALCGPGTYDLVFTVPPGYEPLAGAHQPLECVEWLQVRDFGFTVATEAR